VRQVIFSDSWDYSCFYTIRAWANRLMNTSNLPLLLVLSRNMQLAQWKLSRKEIS